MDYNEMAENIEQYCEHREEGCEGCPIAKICDHLYGDYGEDNPEETKEAYDTVFGDNDMVNHPKHYCRDGGMECIDEMLLIFGKSAVMAYCLLNSWKYRYRAADKNGEEDLRKSDWYINKYKELKEEMDNERICCCRE